MGNREARTAFPTGTRERHAHHSIYQVDLWGQTLKPPKSRTIPNHWWEKNKKNPAELLPLITWLLNSYEVATQRRSGWTHACMRTGCEWCLDSAGFLACCQMNRLVEERGVEHVHRWLGGAKENLNSGEGTRRLVLTMYFILMNVS